MDYDNTLTLAIQVKDWGKAKAWYAEVLGFKLQYEVTEIGWCEFETPVPGLTIGLDRVEQIDTGNGPVMPTLGVKDIDAARLELEAKGVVFPDETFEVEGMVKLAKFQDPDGNLLCLAQSLIAIE